jgi:hypothetical protein
LTNFQFYVGGEHEKRKFASYGRKPGNIEHVVQRLRTGNRNRWSD